MPKKKGIARTRVVKEPPKPVPVPVAPKAREVEVTLDEQRLFRVQVHPTDDGLIASVAFAEGYLDGDGQFQAVERRRATFKGEDASALAPAWADFEAALWALIEKLPEPFVRPTNQGEPIAVAPAE